MIHVFYNPLADNKCGERNARKVELLAPQEQYIYEDLTQIHDVFNAVSAITPQDKIIIAGGDGTLNHIVNDFLGRVPQRDIWYYACGSGNDFYKDVKSDCQNELILLNDYITNLPTVDVSGSERLFLNNVGYGLDGYCCEEGDRQRRKSGKPINYSLIALKGLLFAYKPVSARITVDGKSYTYKKVWLAPAMNGRYYGGGIMMAPDQQRLNSERKLSFVVVHGITRLGALLLFPKIFTGKHTVYKKYVEVISGHDILVEFSRPTALQIDGETVLGVTKYRAVSHTAKEARSSDKLAV